MIFLPIRPRTPSASNPPASARMPKRLLTRSGNRAQLVQRRLSSSTAALRRSEIRSMPLAVEPSHDSVGDRNLINVTSLQLGEEVARLHGLSRHDFSRLLR